MLLASHKFRALGTEIEIFLVLPEGKSESDAQRAFEDVEDLYEEKEKLLSRFDPGSELSQLNSRLGTYQSAAEDILALAEKSLQYHKLSDGYFDPRILETLEDIGYDKSFFSPDFGKKDVIEKKLLVSGDLTNDLQVRGKEILFGRRMDFSGIAKGYITDLASRYLSDAGWENFLVDSGGDMFASGKNETGESWRIGLEGNLNGNIVLALSGAAVATSGISRRKWTIGSERYHHLINPKDPHNFSFDLKSVTVWASKCEEADVWAKVLFLMGKEKGRRFAKEKGLAGLFLDYRGNIWISEKMRDIIVQ